MPALTEAATSKHQHIKEGNLDLKLHYNEVGSGDYDPTKITEELLKTRFENMMRNDGEHLKNWVKS